MPKCIKCGMNASFGIKGSKNVEFCESCIPKIDGEIYRNEKDDTCIICDKTQASFVKKNEKPIYPNKKANYCAGCFDKNFENELREYTIGTTCKGCGKKGSINYNISPELPAQYCSNCFKNSNVEMFYIYKKCKHKKGSKDRCTLRADYNKPGLKGEYCIIHKTNEMKNVVNKFCEYHKNGITCCTIPTYNYEGELKATHCSKHGKELNMVDVKNSFCQRCFNFRASFNYPNETKRLYCADCAFIIGKGEMINLSATYCPGSPETNICLYKNTCHYGFKYCAICDPDPERRVHKKEQDLFKFVKSMYGINKYNIYFDRTIPNQNLLKRRPDINIELEKGNVIIECDEFAHRDKSSYPDDLSRMIEIYKHLLLSRKTDYLEVIFIRFNPDKYKLKHIDGNFYPYNTDINQRYHRLKDVIYKCINIVNTVKREGENIFYSIRLFYDNIKQNVWSYMIIDAKNRQYEFNTSDP